jgi:hypothetical protein
MTLQRRPRAVGFDHPIAVLREALGQRPADQRLVVDDEDGRRLHVGRILVRVGRVSRDERLTTRSEMSSRSNGLLTTRKVPRSSASRTMSSRPKAVMRITVACGASRRSADRSDRAADSGRWRSSSHEAARRRRVSAAAGVSSLEHVAAVGGQRFRSDRFETLPNCSGCTGTAHSGHPRQGQCRRMRPSHDVAGCPARSTWGC